MSEQPNSQMTYQPEIRNDKGISPLWILPIITILLAGWLVYKAIHDAGQRVQIYFSDAAGLVSGRTTIRYHGLEVGIVRDIKLSEDLGSIYVDADIYPEAEKLLNNETRFWLVKPTASLSGISGLDALVSGNYIAIQPGNGNQFETEFRGLEQAPSDLTSSEGLNLRLRTKDLGGVSVGSKIVYKKIPIGEVFHYKLEPDAQSIVINANIDPEYKHIINSQSRFWNVSGIGAHVGVDGIDVRLENMGALFNGAIAVDSPDDGEPVESQSEFDLYPNLKTAGRGIAVSITLPDDNKVSGEGSPIMYRGLEVGQITDLTLSENRETIIASAAIQPAFSDMLTTGTEFILEEAKLSVTGVENIVNLVKGNFLTLVPGEGERARDFSAIRKNEFNQQQKKYVATRLISNNSFGLDAGANILYRGIVVGTVSKVGLFDKPLKTGQEVYFDILIKQQFTKHIKSNNRFYVTGSASAELTEAGLSVTIPPAKQLLSGSISFVSEGSSKKREQYELFQNASLAELAKYDQVGTKTLTLIASELPPISKGSPLLYRNHPVGTVADFDLVDGSVRIDVSIENRFSHLVTDKTVFWNYSGIDVEASLSGINITTSPLKSIIKGGIAFDTMPGIENKLGNRWKLYSDQKEARKFGRVIKLYTDGTQQVAKGTAIHYQGVNVGEVTLVMPDFKNEHIEVTARILPEFVDVVAVRGSHFWLEQPEISLNGINNLKALIANSIAVKPGKTAAAHFEFKLNNKQKEAKGTRFVLESEQRDSLTEGTPVLYREMEVGRVISVELGKLADRIITTIEVAPEYAYLVRKNSVFWNVSGVDVSIGLTGANIKAGTIASIVKGGVAFATPESNTLQPRAPVNQSFTLYSEAEEEWLEWQTKIPKL